MSTTVHLPKPELRAVSSLKPHPLRTQLPKIAKCSLAFLALSESIRDHGITHPIDITPDGHIIKGLDRWRIAKDYQHAEIPCFVRADKDAALLIVEGLVARKQMQRGAAVYCVIPVLSDFFARCETRRLENLAHGKPVGAEIPKKLQKDQCFSKSGDRTSEGDETVATVIAKLGVGKETFWQARKLWLLLNEPGADFLRTEMGKQGLALPGTDAVKYQTHQRNALEPRLLAGELGVGAALAGMAGKASTQGTTRIDSVARQAHALDRLFRTPLATLPRVMERVIADADPEQLEEMNAVAAEIARLTMEALETSFRAHAAEQSDKVGVAYGN